MIKRRKFQDNQYLCTMSNWKQTLLQEAHKKGMCGDYLKPLTLCADKITAIELCMKEPRWALSHDLPTISELRKWFSLYEVEGLYVDRKFSGESLTDHNCYILHSCNGEIATGLNIDKAIIPDIHISNGSHLKIKSVGPAVRIDIFVYGDDNVVETEGDSKFIVHRHDKN